MVSTEAEAAMVCGYLAERGIHATHEKGGLPGLRAYTARGGSQEILVPAAELDAARKALAALDEATT